MALEGISWADATEIAAYVEQIAVNAARREIAAQLGAFRDYAWSIVDPSGTDDPPPLAVNLPCKPVEVIASCVTAPGSTLTIDVLRSIDAGATFESILETTASIASGDNFGGGAAFLWEDEETRALVAPHTDLAYPVQLLVGDLIDIALTGGAGAASLSVQVRVQRVGEHVRRGGR